MTPRFPTTVVLPFVLGSLIACGSKGTSEKESTKPAKPWNGSPVGAEFVAVTDVEGKPALRFKLHSYTDKPAVGYTLLARFYDANNKLLKVQKGTPFEKDYDFNSIMGNKWRVDPGKSLETTVRFRVPAGAKRADMLVTRVSTVAADGLKTEKLWSAKMTMSWPERAGKTAAAPPSKPPAKPVKTAAAKPEVKNALVTGDALGLSDPKNDADLVTKAKAVLACDWDKEGRVKRGCEALKAFTKASRPKTMEATLINFLGATDRKVRYLGARGLDSTAFRDYTKDKQLSLRVLLAATKEREASLAYMMGGLAGAVRAKDTGHGKLQQQLFNQHPNKKLRLRLLGVMQWLSSSEHFEFTAKQTKSSDDDLRKKAIDAFWIGTPSGKEDEVCTIWFTALSDSKENIRTSAAGMIGHRKCHKQYAKAIGVFAKLPKKELSMSHVHGLGRMYDSKKLSRRQSRQVVAMVQKMLRDKKVRGTARSSALRFLVKDAKLGKRLARRYAADKDFFVKNEASRLIKAKKRRR